MHKAKIILVTMLVVIAVVLVIVFMLPKKSIVTSIPSVENAYEPVPKFSEYKQVKEKKKAFFNYLAPAVKAQNDYIKLIRQEILGYQAKEASGERLSHYQIEELKWLTKEYRVETNQDKSDMYQELLRKIDIIPSELVLVQAANESAWGTSRFAQKGYNFFGLWCFKKGCGFVPSRRNEDASHEVAKFTDLSSAMYSYMRNLNRHPAYNDMRAIRYQLRSNQKPITANAMAGGLLKYSERGEDYVKELRQMIRINKELIAL